MANRMNPCKRLKVLRRSRAGFAYLWLLMVIALAGLGLSAAAEIYATSVRRDKENELIGVGRQFRNAIGRYYEMQLTAGKHEYPTSLDDLLQDKRSPGVRRHLRKIFVDPMTQTPDWGLLRVSGRIVGVHSLSEAAPIKQDQFEVEEMGFRRKAKYRDWIFTYPPDLLQRTGAALPDIATPYPGVPAASANNATISPPRP